MTQTGQQPGEGARLTSADIVRHTEEALLSVLRTDGPSSRAHISRVAGLSKPTISDASNRLLAAGILTHRGTQRSERGRPIELYDINADHGHAVGVAIERGHVGVRALDYAGNVLREYRADTATDDNVPDALTRAGELLRRTSGEIASPRLAAAVAVAAPVDPQTAKIVAWPNSPFADSHTALGPALGIPDDYPLHVDNDVNWATLAEHRIGSMRDVDDFLYVYLGAGVGAGLFLSGRVYRGFRGLAGEICFLRMEDGEIFVHKLARSTIGTHDGWGGSIDISRAIELFEDPAARENVRPIIDDIARIIANIATTIDPGRIVLGGPLAESPSLVDVLNERLELPSLADVPISASELGPDAPLYGAAIGALELARRQRETAGRPQS